MKNPQPFLILSYIRLMTAMAFGDLGGPELDVSLFYLERTRAHIMNTTDVAKIEASWAERVKPAFNANEALLLLQNCLLKAEAEGRVCWRTTYTLEKTIKRKPIASDLLDLPLKELASADIRGRIQELAKRGGEALRNPRSIRKKLAPDRTITLIGATSGNNHQLDRFLQRNGFPSLIPFLEDQEALRLSARKGRPRWGRAKLHDRPLSTYDWMLAVKTANLPLEVIW